MPNGTRNLDPISAAMREAKRKLVAAHFRDPNVVGLALGHRESAGELTPDLAVQVLVMAKEPSHKLPASAILPRSIDIRGTEVGVDVIETGPVYAAAYTERERPAPSGISIGHTRVTAGTLGCLVRDDTDGTLAILSNNHVLADENKALKGDPILQPGPVDGGLLTDTIATLKRWINIDFTGGSNVVDCAIAEVKTENDVVNAMKGGAMSPPVEGQAAVALLFAGSCTRTIGNPIDAVLSQLNVSLLGGVNARSNAVLNGAVQKTGRTTQYTTGRVSGVDATVKVTYDSGVAVFDHQILFSDMSSGGDSGSVVCYGGSGQIMDICKGGEGIGPCASVTLAEQLTGCPFAQDYSTIREARDGVLRGTLIGDYVIDVFYRNEERLQVRGGNTTVELADKLYSQSLYSKHAGDAKLAYAERDKPSSVLRLYEPHIDDARAALETARKYLTEDEYAAGLELVDLVRGEFLYKNTYEARTRLNDAALYDRLRAILAKVRFLDTSEFRPL